MINHVRTLLANLDGQGAARGPGEEYTPPEFRSLALPSYLQAIRAILYGRNPDRRTVLYRTRQFMAILHDDPELAQFVFAYDTRVTYLPVARGGFELVPSVVTTPIGDAGDLTVLGTPPGQDAAGRTQFQWTITVTA